jgi:hypothetical protein
MKFGRALMAMRTSAILGFTWSIVSTVPLNISKSANLSFWRNGGSASVLETLAAEHPEFELSITTALKNLREELTAFAAAPNGGPRISARLWQLENEKCARV